MDDPSPFAVSASDKLKIIDNFTFIERLTDESTAAK